MDGGRDGWAGVGSLPASLWLEAGPVSTVATHYPHSTKKWQSLLSLGSSGASAGAGPGFLLFWGLGRGPEQTTNSFSMPRMF